jgi:anti-anti-sigma regulatory factor
MAEFAIVFRGDPGRAGTATEIGIAGPLTHVTAPALRDYLRRALTGDQNQPPHLGIDLSCCTGLDVDGMSTLAAAQATARSRGGDLSLVAVPPLLTHRLRQHGYNDLVPDRTSDAQ